MVYIDPAVQESEYAYMNWAMAIPGVGDILRQAVTEGWEPGGSRFTSAIEQTDWWKTTAASAREWTQLQAQDPATASATRNAMLLKAQDYAGNYDAGDINLDAIVDMSLKTGQDIGTMIRVQSGYYSKQRAEEAARDARSAQAAANANYRTIQSIAEAYALPLSPTALQGWAEKIGNLGPISQFEDYAREQAKSLFPGLTDAIDRGTTVRQYVDPYLQILSTEVGSDPSQYDIRDPAIMQALNVVEPSSGKRVSMSLDQWTSTVRSDPRLGFDKSAKGQQMATQLAEALNQKFGNVG